jgi:hypothetical protein
MGRAAERLQQIQRILDSHVTLNDVQLIVKPPQHPELVPFVQHLFNLDSQETLSHLRWMIQKGNLKQDMYLIG